VKTNSKRKDLLSASLSRRQFLKAGVAGGAALATAGRFASSAPAIGGHTRPNFLLIAADQLSLSAISAHGCPWVNTPNMDRLARCGASFMQSYTTDPVCSPARSSWFTGRMPSETGVISNNKPIRPDLPNLGQWLGREGYETVYVGKWHLPQSFSTQIPGFTVIPGGLSGQGNTGDVAVSRACQAYLANRSRRQPFLLAASFLQPHDICAWVGMRQAHPEDLPYPEIENELPPLPANFDFDPLEPERLKKSRRPAWSERQWRYYLWSYGRHVEMVDAEIGRVLQALNDSGQARNTIVVFTSDHGEGMGRHHMVLKNYLYDEAAKVPLIMAFPEQWTEGRKDATHLVSGLDVTPTICDYAGVKPPASAFGRSLRPLVEGASPEWREFLVSEVQVIGRMVRSPDLKYVVYRGDPIEQLFDMKNDPGETKNLAAEARFSFALEDHRKRLKEWEARLDLAPAAAKS